MKLLFDEMYSERVAGSLRGRGHDATHVREVGLGGAPDAEVLTRAAEEGRTLVTENAADFLPLLDQRQSAGLLGGEEDVSVLDELRGAHQPGGLSEEPEPDPQLSLDLLMVAIRRRDHVQHPFPALVDHVDAETTPLVEQGLGERPGARPSPKSS